MDYIQERKPGGQRVRDGILCTIIGLQNDNGNRVESEEYKAYQKVMNAIIDYYGDYAAPLKN
jgi:hypothetical protein